MKADKGVEYLATGKMSGKVMFSFLTKLSRLQISRKIKKFFSLNLLHQGKFEPPDA